jgi:hypothetical protein
MTETRAIAHLPTLDIEVIRRELPDEGAEQIAVRLTAKPSFEAFGVAFRQALPAMIAMNPAFFWLGMWRQAAELWLRLPAPGADDRAAERGDSQAPVIGRLIRRDY